MKKLIYTVLFVFGYLSVASAQYSPNDALLTIGNRKISSGEFERIFNKNYNVNSNEKQSVESYFNLFLKFELKVSAALDAGIDTLASFKNELKGYRNQLAKSYLTDNDLTNKLIEEAYDRTMNEVNVSHIMIKLAENPSPEDTLKAFTRITDIQKKLLAGESFEKLAEELSEDPSAKQNKGKIGFISAFRIPIYTFENAAYNTKVGGISKPIRTKFGYHIIKVNDKRISPGEVKIAHIMIAVPQGSNDNIWSTAKNKIDSIFQNLQKGQDFSQLARQYSDDRNSGNKGGELAWFGTGRMVPEFEEAAFAIKTIGEVAKPIKTSFGWHILKLLDKHEVAKFDQIKNDLKNKVLQSDRAEIINHSFVDKLRKDYTPKTNSKNLSAFYALDSTIYHNKVNLPQDKLAQPLLTIKKQIITGADFKVYLESKRYPDKKVPVKDYINQSFNTFTEVSLMQYEDEHLEQKYAEFDNLIKEYHDGILLFDIMDSKVWTKASQDTAGLEAYYNQLSNKPSWGERLDACILTCNTKESAEKAKKFISKDDKFTDDKLLKAVCDTIKGLDCMKIERKLFSKGDQHFIDSIAWKKGFTAFSIQQGKVLFAYIWGTRAAEPKQLDDIRGLITADYQNYIEDKWINQLKNNYKVEVNDKLLHQIADKYKDTH